MDPAEQGQKLGGLTACIAALIAPLRPTHLHDQEIRRQERQGVLYITRQGFSGHIVGTKGTQVLKVRPHSPHTTLPLYTVENGM